MRQFSFILHSPLILIVLSLLGIFDSIYLTYIHYSGIPPHCSGGIFADCGKVLTSSYAEIWGVPLALIGVIYYSLEFTVLTFTYFTRKRYFQTLVVFMSTGGLFASGYFTYLQLVVLGALCQYCVLSAIISLLLFAGAFGVFPRGRTTFASLLTAIVYKYILKPLLFRLDPEKVHTGFVAVGAAMGEIPLTMNSLAYVYKVSDPRLSQNICGITFPNPVGLAAGFDYEANLTRILSSLSFGFQSVGTITNGAYGGNPRPMLGRLPRSRSLMVNKGFKNLGTDATIKKLAHKVFPVPVGVSIGRTNTRKLVTLKESIDDIIAAFTKFEKSSIAHVYYELNISCPNLYGSVTFYPPKNLEELLREVDLLRLSRPLFVKMPINESDREQLAMLQVIAKHSPAGVIYGNLQKDRQHPNLVPHEVAQFSKGNFSGKPTYDRSNELISLAYRYYKDRFIIIGCGGIFSAEDAWEKITRGASLVQLITGMVFEGPQLISDINNGLLDLLERLQLQHISQAVGSTPSRIVN